MEIKNLEVLREVSNLPQVQAVLARLEEGTGVSALYLLADGSWSVLLYTPVSENPDHQVGIHAGYCMDGESLSCTGVEPVYAEE